MLIALLSDIHANLLALEAVTEHARKAGAEAFWHLGDYVGYGPWPEEVVRFVQSQAAINIIGNYDLKVLAFERKQEKWRRKKHPEKFLAFQWAFENLSDSSKKYLGTLDETCRLEINKIKVLLTHGSPDSIDEHLFRDTPDARFRELAQTAEADLIACGHSHQEFVKRCDEIVFVNPGSVGRPEGGDPRASYALLDLSDGRITVELFRVEYDLVGTIHAIEKAGLPMSFAQMFLTGKNLEEVDNSG